MTGPETPTKPNTGTLSMIGPGILIAATGVGAGDLATGAIVGSHLGTTVLWAVIVGAVLKFALTEGLARWQLVTGETILEGALFRFGRIAQGIFLLYLLIWSFAVGAALMGACGVTAHAIKGDMERCFESGMDDYLSKPVSPEKLEEKINKWINSSDGEMGLAAV